MSIGKQIKKLRERSGLTQEKLAELLLISRQSISKWEQDLSLPQIVFIKQLAKIFNCSYEELLDGEDVEI